MNFPTSLNDLVRQRIQSDFVQLIPEENWATLVNSTVSQFTTKRKRGNYQDERYTSDLDELIIDHLKEIAKAAIKEELSKPEHQVTWNNGNPIAGAIVQEVVDNHAHKIFSMVVGSMVANVMQNMRGH